MTNSHDVVVDVEGDDILVNHLKHEKLIIDTDPGIALSLLLLISLLLPICETVTLFPSARLRPPARLIKEDFLKAATAVKSRVIPTFTSDEDE